MSKSTHNSNAAAGLVRTAPALVRACVGAVVACCTLLMAVAPAHAVGPGERDRRGERDGGGEVRDGRDLRERSLRDPRTLERAEEHRRMLQESGNAEMSRRVDRMTPDERRDLRRQINEAGQEIYVRPPRR